MYTHCNYGNIATMTSAKTRSHKRTTTWAWYNAGSQTRFNRKVQDFLFMNSIKPKFHNLLSHRFVMITAGL